MRPFTTAFCAGLIVVAMLGSGCRSTYYAAYEKLGVYKRDLFKRRVVAARDEEQAAGEQFKDALTRLKELYAFDGGELEKRYRTLQSDYDDSVSRADAVRKRVRDLEQVANDLFAEWEQEITQISTPELQSGSRQKLSETRARYATLHTALLQAEQSMDPVLTKFRDHVLFLKHNLNASAVASLKGEAAGIQGEITRLISRMTESVAQADAFIKTLD